MRTTKISFSLLSFTLLALIFKRENWDIFFSTEQLNYLCAIKAASEDRDRDRNGNVNGLVFNINFLFSVPGDS